MRFMIENSKTHKSNRKMMLSQDPKGLPHRGQNLYPFGAGLLHLKQNFFPTDSFFLCSR